MECNALTNIETHLPCRRSFLDKYINKSNAKIYFVPTSLSRAVSLVEKVNSIDEGDCIEPDTILKRTDNINSAIPRLTVNQGKRATFSMLFSP